MIKKRLSIGEFAKLKNVSVKSLRYYDTIGILKPAYVNEATGYRYYISEQMIVLDVILLCLAFNLPLKSLHGYCEGNGPPHLQQMILDCQEKAFAKLHEAQKMLTLSQDILAQIERLNQPHLEKELYKHSFQERAVLTLPWFDGRDNGKTYIKKISALSECARDADLTILSQQGILHDYWGEKGEQYVFLAVEPAPHTKTGYRQLPAADYTCMVLRESEITSVPTILAANGVRAQFSLHLNTDIYDYCLSHHLHLLEVQSYSG